MTFQETESQPLAPDNPPALFQPILNALCAQALAYCVYIYHYEPDTRQFERVAALPDQPPAFDHILMPQFVHAANPYSLDKEELSGTGYTSAVIFPLTLSGETL